MKCRGKKNNSCATQICICSHEQQSSDDLHLHAKVKNLKSIWKMVLLLAGVLLRFCAQELQKKNNNTKIKYSSMHEGPWMETRPVKIKIWAKLNSRAEANSWAITSKVDQKIANKKYWWRKSSLLNKWKHSRAAKEAWKVTEIQTWMGGCGGEGGGVSLCAADWRKEK